MKKTILALLATGIILLSFLILSSCVTQKACIRKFPPEVSDSVVEKTTIVYKDTTIHIKGETIRDTIRYQIDCDKQGHGTLKPINKKKEIPGSELTVTTTDNSIIVTSECKDKDLLIQKQKEMIDKMEKENKTITLPPVKFIPWWIWAIIGLSVGLNIIFLFLFLIRKIIL